MPKGKNPLITLTNEQSFAQQQSSVQRQIQQKEPH